VNQAGDAAGIIARETVDVLRTGENKFDGGKWLELGWNAAFGFDDELFVLNVKTDRRVGLIWVCILAGQRFELGGRRRCGQSLRFGLRRARRPGQIERDRKNGNANGEDNKATANQG
jgi:hypothetical protein